MGRSALALFGALLGCATVPPGAGGVLWTASGGISPEPLAEGQHFVGLTGAVDVYDLRAQERNEDLFGLGADGAPIEAGASVVTFHLVAAELPALDREVGPAYYQTVVAPLVRATARRVLARLRSSELDTAHIRAAQAQLRDLLAPALRPLHVVIDDVVFRRVIPTSPLAYASVLETGQAEQAAIQARADIEAAYARAEQRRAEAHGVAGQLDTVGPSLTPQSLDEARLRARERLLTSPSTSVLVRPDGESPLLLEVPP